MIAGKPVSVAGTKSFGCPIKMVRKNNAASDSEQSGVEEAVFIQANYSPGFANSFVPQKKPVRKPAAAKKSPAPAATPQIALLKPEDFNKFKDAANGNYASTLPLRLNRTPYGMPSGNGKMPSSSPPSM